MDAGLTPDNKHLRRLMGLGYVLLGAAVFYANLRDGDGKSVPTWIWAVVTIGGTVVAVGALAHFVRTFNEPVRNEIDWRGDRFWHVVVLTTFLLIGFGLAGVVDGDPETPAVVGACMFFAGCIEATLLLRHVAKPVRSRAHPDE